MKKRIFTLFLAAVMLAGSAASAVSAAVTTGTKATADTEEEVVVDYDTMTFDEIYATKVDEDGDPVINYLADGFLTPEEKLATMVKVYEDKGYELWYEYYTGEVALKDTRTGQIMMTNPYDVSGIDSMSSSNVRKQLLSQISITFLDNGQSKTYYSYQEAAERGQISIRNIKGGVRVEYTIGEESTIRLVPRMIEKSRFENLIYKKITNETIKKKLSGKGYWVLYDITDPDYSESKIRSLLEEFPILEKMAVYIFDDSEKGYLKQAENLIKTFVPDYSYDDMEYDHELTGYVGNDQAPPCFKMALEYTVEDDGLSVRLSANGIRYDESVYQLTSVSVLPWMGAGNSKYTGYTFIPDGSGALIRFEDITNTYNISGEMYGADYSYHEITGQHAEVMRYPVYGVISDLETGTEGFVAIITEGDSMTKILSTHGGSMHSYNSVYGTFNPRPYDTYSLSSSVTGGTASWTVTSERRYTGSYRIKYVLLPSESAAQSAGLKDSYEPSYVGMAKAYRDYLESTGVLTRLTENDVEENIPLYVESFGSIETDDRFLSIPVKVDSPLTTFEDVKTMYNELTEMGVGNINFKLTGFANGGLDSTYPYKLSWMRVLGGNSGFKDLAEYANEKGFSLYPEFDFSYLNNDTTFDGISLKKHAVRTIDNRYTSKRYYDAATQTWQNDFALAISPSVYETLYAKFSEHLGEYNVTGISAASLGTDLNSDFDNNEPYNREDSKIFTSNLLEDMSENYNVMVSGGNAYTFKYADVILGMSTESSKYVKSSASVPFIGMVLHGYIRTAGQAFNMEGDIDSAVLHAIENGSYPYFMLSYRNTELLKESVKYSEYFSVGYDVWKEGVVKYYNELNGVLADLQTTLITDHQFISAYRIPDDDEIEADEEAAKLQAEIEAAEKAEADRKAQLAALYEERKKALGLKDTEVDTTDEDEEDTETEAPKPGTPANNNDAEVNSDYSTSEKYATSEGSVIRVEYEDGTSFILNYNSFAIKAVYNGQTYEVGSLGFVRIDG